MACVVCLFSSWSFAADKPLRVISLLPSTTEIVCELGYCDRLVGVDRYSNWPSSVSRLPKLGSGLDPDFERVVSLRPDLVICPRSSRSADRLKALGLQVLVIEPENFDELQLSIQTIARALHAPDQAAQVLWGSMQAQLRNLVKRVPDTAKTLRVYVEVGSDLYAAAPTSALGQTLHTLGFKNIVPDSMGPFPKLSSEWVIKQTPDMIVLLDSPLRRVVSRPGWSTMPAVQHKRVCVFDAQTTDALVRPGPRMIKASESLLDCLLSKAQS